MIVSGGGLTKFTTWKSRGDNFFLPVKALAKKFRGKFLSLLKHTVPDAPQTTINTCWDKKWVVYCKKPFGGPEQVVKYLSRYTHRIAITDNRIVEYSGDKVTFSYRDCRDDNKQKQMTLDAVEFVRRFMLHVLPKGFRKIRCYGLFAPRNKRKRLKQCPRSPALAILVRHGLPKNSSLRFLDRTGTSAPAAEKAAFHETLPR